MARPRSPSYDDQRDLIVQHAAALFAQKGYPATSMNEVAQACGLSKPSLYHYFRDKYALLVTIAETHVRGLLRVVEEVEAAGAPGVQRLRELVARFMNEYAHAQNAHRVLTEDVRFLEGDDRARVLETERRVVQAFARAITEVRPELDAAGLAKPLTMLLFGMINWMFTWLKPDGQLTHEAMAPVVADLFLGGLPAVQAGPVKARPACVPAVPRARRASR